MKRKKTVRIIAIIIAATLALSLLMMPFAGSAFAAEKEDGSAVLFARNGSSLSAETPAPPSGTVAESALGDLLADAMRYAAETAGEDADSAAMAFLTETSIRAAFPAGALTDGSTADIPLYSFYLTGKELSGAAELDASIGRVTPEACLQFSGIRYTYNPNRLPVDTVIDLKLVHDDGSVANPAADQLYRVVTDEAALSLLAEAKELSYGFIKLTPKDASGAAVSDLSLCTLTDTAGAVLTLGDAAALYTAANADTPAFLERYDAPQERKILEDDSSLPAILADPGAMTLFVMGAFVILTLALILVGRFFMKRWFKHIDYHEDRLGF